MREKIYCTRCGREIRDGLLYCDRCGQSVRKSMERQKPLKYRQIEEIHKERTVRKQHQQEKAIKRKQQKEKALKRTRAMVLVLLLLIIALICVLIGYISMSNDGGMKDMDDLRQENISATEEPEATASANVVITTTSPSEIDTDYTQYAISGQTVSYPSSFVSVDTQGGESIRLTDESGGGVITIGQETPSGSANEMMGEYYSKAGLSGEPEVSTANQTRYLITYTLDGTVTHRKLVIKNGAAVYYEFTYSSSSSSKSEYEQYIEEMDALFSD
ncbi:MAG: zinc ribbon domain-containing protein [Firmicutes bacterium]|nr:zinc ribbon domain-containing protein [Bacillota bacterium]